jgi:uncharacterized short protein YbdD (DUF466 family)
MIITFKQLNHKFKHLWHIIRQLSGDDAYERYLKHHAAFHETAIDAPPPLTRKAFVKLWQENQWAGVNRCC